MQVIECSYLLSFQEVNGKPLNQNNCKLKKFCQWKGWYRIMQFLIRLPEYTDFQLLFVIQESLRPPVNPVLYYVTMDFGFLPRSL